MKPVVFHPDARQDLLEAALYYDERRPGLGDRFLELVEMASERLQAFPALGNPSIHGTRRVLLKRFPYQVVYREKTEEIQILAVCHLRRLPGFWDNRLANH